MAAESSSISNAAKRWFKMWTVNVVHVFKLLESEVGLALMFAMMADA